jgi:aspartyl/glutamyl-tRNA(Asn/Gln) amidotransferase C subunit
MLDKYVTKAAKMSLIKFESESEKIQMNQDFKSALQFVFKLSEVKSEGVEPLENVLEFYGGNQDKMRGLETEPEDSKENMRRMKQVNSNMRGNLCVAPKAFNKEIAD